MSGFFSNLKDSASAAADKIKKAATDTYEEMSAPPKTVKCQQCAKPVDVPANTFDWICVKPECHKVNKRSSSKCVGCQTARPKIPDPFVQCAACQAFTKVPTTKAQQQLSEAATATKDFVLNAGDKIKQEYQYLKSKPVEFNCEHCTTRLAVPPWACGACAAINDCREPKCARCGGARGEKEPDLVLCGVCNQPTKVPSMNILNSLQKTSQDVFKGVQKVYWDLSGKPYIHCARCTKAIVVSKEPSKEEAKAGSTQVEGKAAVPAGQAAQRIIVCPNCQTRLLVPERGHMGIAQAQQMQQPAQPPQQQQQQQQQQNAGAAAAAAAAGAAAGGAAAAQQQQPQPPQQQAPAPAPAPVPAPAPAPSVPMNVEGGAQPQLPQQPAQQQQQQQQQPMQVEQPAPAPVPAPVPAPAPAPAAPKPQEQQQQQQKPAEQQAQIQGAPPIVNGAALPNVYAEDEPQSIYQQKDDAEAEPKPKQPDPRADSHYK